MKKRNIWVICAAAALAVTTGLGVAISAQAGSDDVAVGEVASILFSPADAADALPVFLTEGGQAHSQLSPETARSLGSLAGSQYWIAQSTGGDVCLVVLVSGPDQLASSTCVPAKVAVDSGLTLQVQSAATGITERLYLIPDGYIATISGSLSKVSDQLVVGVTNSSAAIDVPVVRPAEGAKGSTPVEFRSYPIEPLLESK